MSEEDWKARAEAAEKAVLALRETIEYAKESVRLHLTAFADVWQKCTEVFDATPADLAERYIERSKVEALAFAASGAEEFLKKRFSSLSMAGVKWNHPGAQKAYAALEAALDAAGVKP